MKILFIHQNFPAQFCHLSAALASEPGNQVVALAMRSNPVHPAVRTRVYGLLREAAPQTHPLLAEQEAQILRAEACAAAAFSLRQEGFIPDVIVAHPGWGEALFIKDVFPQARLVLYCEYYYALEGQDVGFDPEAPALSFAQRCRLRLRNTSSLLSLESADAAYAPTQWQRSTYPAWAQARISVVHDGIDATRLRFDPQARLTLANPGGGAVVDLKAGDEVLSYVARNLEPVRGFHVFMRALPAILAQRPQAQVVIVGSEEPGYGHQPADGRSWKEALLAEVGAGLDLSRVHFTGKLSYGAYLQLLSVSRVHAYWTTPFVLSWSFLEAACSGLPVVASDTPPVAEFADRLGVATRNFFDTAAIEQALLMRLDAPMPRHPARQLDELDVSRCVGRQIGLLRPCAGS